MPYKNISHVEKGRLFQEQVRQALTAQYGVEFLAEHPLTIGNPPKKHKFDLVSADCQYVAECKNISWRKTDKKDVTPQAKISSCNDDVRYLSLLPSKVNKLLIIRKDTHPVRAETLAQYYKRTYNHLLNEVRVFEFDPDSGKLTEI